MKKPTDQHKSLPRYFVVPMEITPLTPANVVLEVLVRKPGDTYGIARVFEKGNIEFWNHGKKVGTFKTFKEVYDAADALPLC